jgi:choline dehydrogenase-like flavoprotein
MSLYSELAGKWDKQADVIVVGFGAAGTAAAITAQDAGASVLMLEKAPKGEEGGNTRVAGQGYLNAWPVDEAIEYFNALCGPFTVPQEVVHAWAREVSKNNDWLTSIGGDPQEHQHPPAGIEFPPVSGKWQHSQIPRRSGRWIFQYLEAVRAGRGRKRDRGPV